MPKTYNTFTDVSAGSVLTASAYNDVLENIGNYRVPPMARIVLSQAFAVANNSHTSFTGFTSTNGTQDIDTDDMVTLSGTASAITVQTAGVYKVSAQVQWNGGSNGVRLTRAVRSRSGTLTNVASTQGIHASGNAVTQNCSGLISCNVGDLIRLMVYQTDGGNLNMNVGDEYGTTFLSAVWVGQTT